jgi:hypothetical protein
MLKECKSWQHTYSVGDQVFDLLSKQMVTIQKIVLVKDKYEEDLQSVKPSDDSDIVGDDYFVVTVDAGNRTIHEFCLLEEAERFRGFDFVPSEGAEAYIKAGGWFGSSVGEMTIEQRNGGWIVCEDGKRVGGTLRRPFKSRDAAQRWLDSELAAEAETMAEGDIGLSARCKVIRHTDPETWEKIEEIEDQYAGNDIARNAAHRLAGTSNVMMEMACASLEAEGKIERREIDGKQMIRLTSDKN